jgi:MGT family glycosyltransferase
MGRFLVVTWDGAGNLLATLGIAQRLAQRGHDVRLFGHRSIQRRYGDRGWRFLAFDHTADFDSSVATNVDAEFQALAEKLWFSRSVARDVAAELEREPADVVLADCMLMGALSAGQAAGVPTAALFHTAVAPFRAGPMLEMMAPTIPAITAMRAELGLSGVDGMADVHDACALSIVAMPKEFEPEMPLPANAVHVGPVLDGPELAASTDHVDVADGPEPLVVVSLSTSYQGQAPLLQRLLDACAELPVRVVATTGPAVDPASIEAPANAQVVQFVPHDDLLPHASLVITHAGLGTVMTALSHGVPLLCVPMGRDQFFNAERVAQLGAGRVLAFDADTESIRSAVLGVLDDSGSRDGAKRMANVIASYAGATTAVSELERLIQGLARSPLAKIRSDSEAT